MSHVIRNWMGLALIAMGVVYGGRWAVSEHVDLTFMQFATVVCATLLQAVVLTWRERRPSGQMRAVAVAVWRQPLVRPVLLLDVAVLGAGLVWWDTHVAGFGAMVSVQYQWTVIKATLATVLLLLAVARGELRGRPTAVAALVGPLLLVFALEPSTSWLAAGFDWLRASMAEEGEVLQRLVVYGATFAVFVFWTLRAARVMEPLRAEVGYLLHGIVAAAIGVAVTVVLATFNLPDVTQPWLGFATLGASLAASFLLMTAIVLHGSR